MRGASLHRGQTVEQLAAAAVEAGAGSVIVLDLARAGMRRGVDVDLLATRASRRPGNRAGSGRRRARFVGPGHGSHGGL